MMPDPRAPAPPARLAPNDPELRVLARLAEATAQTGSPWEAARLVFDGPPAQRAAAVASPRVPVVVLRSVAGQRALIAARSKRKRRAALLLTRWWAR